MNNDAMSWLSIPENWDRVACAISNDGLRTRHWYHKINTNGFMSKDHVNTFQAMVESAIKASS